MSKEILEVELEFSKNSNTITLLIQDAFQEKLTRINLVFTSSNIGDTDICDEPRVRQADLETKYRVGRETSQPGNEDWASTSERIPSLCCRTCTSKVISSHDNRTSCKDVVEPGRIRYSQFITRTIDDSRVDACRGIIEQDDE